MADAEWLKKEIDTIDTNDKIEVQEMEEFLKSEENIKKLGEAMESDVSSELFEEYKAAMKELCSKILENKSEIQPNQFRILLLYLDKFSPEIENQNDKSEEQEGTDSLENKLKEFQERLTESQAKLSDISSQMSQIYREQPEDRDEKLKNLQKQYDDESKNYEKIKKDIKKIKNKIFKEWFNEEYETLEQIKSKDRIYYEVWMFVVKSRQNYIEEMNKRFYDKGKRKTTRIQKHEKVLSKNPFYNLIEENTTKENEEKIQELNKNMKKLGLIFDVENKRAELLDLITKEYERDRNEVENILKNEGELSDTDKNTLLYFKNYYIGFNNNYTIIDWWDKYMLSSKRMSWAFPTREYLVSRSNSVSERLYIFKQYYYNKLSEHFSNDEIQGREAEYNDNEKEKDLKNPIRGIARWIIIWEKPKDIDESYYDWLARKIDEKLNAWKFQSVHAYIEKWSNINGKPLDLWDIKIINERYKEFWKNHSEITKKLKEQVAKEINNITEAKLKNIDGKNPIDRLSQTEIGIFQLWANVEHWENLDLNKCGGKKNNLTKKELSDEEITTLYIYRQTLISRESKQYTKIENIPNLNNLLLEIRNSRERNILFRNFLVDIFIPIANDRYWPIIENSIQSAYNEAGKWDPFARILTLLISKYTLEENWKLDSEAPETRNKKWEHKTYREIIMNNITTEKNWLKMMQDKADEAEKKRQEEIEHQKKIQLANKTVKQIENTTRELEKMLENKNRDSNRKITAKNKFNLIFGLAYSNKLPDIPELKSKWYDKKAIQKNCVWILHNFFTDSEILSNFGWWIYDQYMAIYNENLKLYSQHNEDIDLLCRLEYDNTENGKWWMKINFNGHYQDINNCWSKIKDEISHQQTKLNRGEYFDFHGYKVNTRPWSEKNKPLLVALQVCSHQDGIFIEFPGAINETRINWVKQERTEREYFKWENINWDEFLNVISLLNKAKKGEIKLFYDKSAWKPLWLRNFAVISETKWGGYKLDYKRNPWKKPTYYDSNFIKRTREFRDWATSSLMGSEDFSANIKKLENFENDFKKIGEWRKAMDKNELTADLRKKTIGIAKQMLDKRNELKSSWLVFRLEQQIKQFEKAQNRWGMSSMDKKIRDAKKNLEYLKNLLESNEIQNTLNSLCDEAIFYKNDNWRERTVHRIDENLFSFLVGIWAAVFAIIAFVPSGWFSMALPLSLLATAGIATAWWMVWWRIGTKIDNQRLSGTKTLDLGLYWGTVDIHHSAKNWGSIDYLFEWLSDIINWKVKDWAGKFLDFIATASVEWTCWTITTAAFMWAWMALWKGFSMLADKYKWNFFITTCQKIPFSRLKPPKDPITQDLANGIWRSLRNTNKFWDFLRGTAKELGEETWEEWEEQAFEAINPNLWLAITLWHSLSSTWNTKVYQDNKVCVDGIYRWHNWFNDRIHIRLSYDAKNGNQSFEALKSHLDSEWYKYDKETNTFYQLNEVNHQFLNVIELVPSTQSFERRSLTSELSSYWITLNHENWNIYYSDISSIEELQQNWLRTGEGIVTIDSDTGNVTITTKGNTYHLEKNPLIELKENFEKMLDEWIYFEWKNHKYPVNEEQTIENSEFMDQILDNNDEIWGWWSWWWVWEKEKISKIRERITQFYREITKKELELSDEQLLSIIEAHKQKWILWKLSKEELIHKNRILTETIEDQDVRRFLFEAWFCGSLKLWTDHIWDIAKINHQNINDLLSDKTELKISDMTINDLWILMRKAANMWLDTETLWNIREKINDRITEIEKKPWTYNKEHMYTLKDNIAEISFEIEIRSIEINDPNFETKIDEIKNRINENKKFRESKIWQELAVELDKKKFEYYKNKWKLLEANLTINEIESINKKLLSEDITNFRYKRWLLDVELYKIQLWIGDINTMQKAAEELREDSETIWWRTDINTLLSKIEAWILLWKPQEELDVYLSFLAIQEYDAWVNVLWNVISTISNTFPEQELDDSAKRIEDAWEASKNNDLKQKWNRARKNAEKYKEMKDNLAKDKNGEEKKKLQDKINEFVYEKPIKTITDIWNTFMHPLKLFNYWSVASIEITENTYSKTREILTWKSVNNIQMWTIDMDGNREPTQESFSQYIRTINQKFDTFIRTLYSTEKLQELNSAHHSAGYDANMKSYLDEVWLNDLAQVMEIYWIADCRVHAFTKQIFFDTMKRTELQNLQKKLNSETDPAKRKIIEKQIKILKNTKMVYIDSTLTWNVRMKAKYQAEKWENGHLVRWNENAVIEEHTYNLIEIPTIDSEWNITERNVYYADAFYQGIKENGSDTGRVYDLSFNPDKPITTIYGKTYYTKKDWKYVHDPKVNMHMTTEVIWSDWNKIPITTVPLFRSVQWRGETLKPSNIQSEVLTDGEVTKRNSETRAHVEAIERLNTARSEMMRTMKEALESGDIQKIENILVNGIWTAMHFNVETWTRETGTWLIKISETQAEYLRRAIQIYSENKWNANMQQALNTMIDNIVTQDEVNYRLKSWQATDVDERMWVFWGNTQVFNEVYKSEIEEALNKVKNDPSTTNIEKLQKAIKEYQRIYDSDMKKFFEQNQETMLQENERNETYHRNNFEHVAKRFRSDMELYAGIVKSLENNWLYEQAFEIKQYMIAQCNTLLGHSDKLLWHMIDFKKVKKEMKWIEWREIYIQLLEIQEKWIWNIDAELKKRWIDPKKIKEMVWVDTNQPFNSETLSEAISNIEESWLKEYYDTIALVFTPEILAINMENAVYSKWWYKVETLYNTETKEEYVARKYAEAEVAKQIDKNTEPWKIWQIISNQILEKIDPALLTGKSKADIQAEIQHLADLCSECWIDWQKTYDICKQATEALIFQTVESQTRVMWDHWINHISWNIQKLNIYLEAWVRGWKISENEIWKYKLMWALTHIFHDIWYAATISKWSGSFKGSEIHPFTSKAFFDSNIKAMLEGTGINANLISQGIEAHDGTRLDFSKPETTFLSMVNLSDNMALWVDKMAQLWSNPKLLNHIATLYALNAAWIELKESNKIIAENIRKDTSITPAEQESLISAVNELSWRWLDNIDFWSISPLTAMEFSWDVPTLSMYKWANLMLVAEVCWIRMETEYDENGNIAVDDKWRKKIGLKDAIETKNRDAIISLIKWTKFCSQIVKPLWDYADNYQIMDSNWHEYPKTNWKYNMDEIKADLLLWNSVSLNDWKRTVLNYKYESATDESILAEKNSVYGHIDTAEMLWKWVEAMKRLNTTAIIDELGSLNKTTKEILDKIKNTESIDTKEIIESIDKTMNTLKDALSWGDVTVNSDFESRFKHFQEDITLFKTYVNENKYSELKVTTETIQEEIAMLSSLLVKE